MEALGIFGGFDICPAYSIIPEYPAPTRETQEDRLGVIKERGREVGFPR